MDDAFREIASEGATSAEGWRPFYGRYERQASILRGELTSGSGLAEVLGRLDAAVRQADEEYRRLLWATEGADDRAPSSALASGELATRFGLEVERAAIECREAKRLVHLELKELAVSTSRRWLQLGASGILIVLWAFISPLGRRRPLARPSPPPLIAKEAASLRRSEARFRGQVEILERLARGEPLAPVLEALSVWLDEETEPGRSLIMTADAEGKRLRGGVAHSLPRAVVEQLSGREPPRTGQLHSTASFSVMTVDLESDPAWAAYRAPPLAELELRCCWSVPVLSGGAELLGTVLVFFPEVVRPEGCDQDVMGAAALLAAVAMERKRQHDSLAFTRMAVDHAADAMFWMSGDRFVHVNEAACELIGLSRQDLLSVRVEEIDPMYSRDSRADRLRAGTAGGPIRYPSHHRSRDGKLVPVEVTLGQLRFAGREYCCATVRESSDRQDLERALRESEDRAAALGQGAMDGLWAWNLDTNETWYSPRWKSMIGFTESEIGGSPDEWLERVHPEDRPRLRGALDAHFSGGASHLEAEYRLRLKDQSYRWMKARGASRRGPKGETVLVAGSQTDVHERHALADARTKPLHDTLTGLPNRALFLDVLRRHVGRVRRRKNFQFAVLLLDVDGFGDFNARRGRPAGDEVLSGVARRLDGCLRPGDVVARLEADDFAVLVHRIRGAADATRIAERIHRALQAPFQTGGGQAAVSASIGIAVSQDRCPEPESMLKDAAAALDRARASGPSGHLIHDPDAQARAAAELRTEAGLRRAVEEGAFRIAYQPVVGLRTGRIVGFEAFLRWKHPERGLVPPSEFISVAVETGLIVPMGWWMISESCKQMRSWQDQWGPEAPVFLAVNLSPGELAQADLVPHLKGLLADTGFPPGSLALEVTEAALMENADQAETLLAQLKALGIRIHVDDFGAGYSSLGCLHRLAIDLLKVDRSFVAQLKPADSSWVAVKNIVHLAESMDLRVVAEGVETADQLEQLRDLGCHFGQGDYFSKPVEAELVAGIMAVERGWR
jgi:diguanylate cyclase (GGDEF)-like protein/PAS domain S-box-containing protein